MAPHRPQKPRLLLMHGAGAGFGSGFLTKLTACLEAEKIEVIPFEFKYMRDRAEVGVKRPPAKVPALMLEVEAAIMNLQAKRWQEDLLFIGGKSLGGRVSSLVAAEGKGREQLSGLVCFGYPFHPPGKPDALRTRHLGQIECPALIIQGSRDPFGTKPEVEGYGLPKAIRLHWLEDGDHDFKPRKASGHSHTGHITEAAKTAATFIHSVAAARQR